MTDIKGLSAPRNDGPSTLIWLDNAAPLILPKMQLLVF